MKPLRQREGRQQGPDGIILRTACRATPPVWGTMVHPKCKQIDHPQESVSRYLHNLNTHWAYDMFRDLRARMRSENQRLDSSQLVGTLAKYSERGAAYIETIRSIISFNGLTDFDQAELFGERI